MFTNKTVCKLIADVQGTCLHVVNAGMQIADALAQKMAILGFHRYHYHCVAEQLWLHHLPVIPVKQTVSFDSEHL